MPTAKLRSSITAGATTISQPFTYIGLPSSNGSFGNKQVTLTINSPAISTTQTANCQVFFLRGASNHPGPDLPMAPGVAGPTPNWYFYWSQTSANYGTHVYGGNAGALTGLTHWIAGPNVWRSDIYDAASTSGLAGTWNGAEGIDFFANTCRHEERHRLDMNGFWPNSDRIPAQDGDGDYLPDDQEAALGQSLHPGTTAYDPMQKRTTGIADTFNYGAHFDDDEDYCLWREVPWTSGDADAVDWANPGHQYISH